MMGFTRTHVRVPVKGRRGSPVEAQRLTEWHDNVVYLVRYREGRRTITRATAASPAYFNSAFKEAA